VNERAEPLRRRILKPWNFRAFLVSQLPLAAFSGMSLVSLDDASCVVRLPGGWRTQNPFRSTYFAAQAMAAEMSTGAPAFVLVKAAPASIAMLVREVRGTFLKKIDGPSTFTFADVAGMAATIEAAAATGDGQMTARSTGRTTDGTIAAEFEITWTFKRRDPR
jgi:hypothetical protein